MTQHDVNVSPDVVMGTLFSFGRKAHSLIDSGATHSFISFAFAIYADHTSDLLDSELMVAIPVGDSLLASSVYKDCLIRVEGKF